MINKNVLVLNKDYQPLKIISWQDAFCKLESESYDVLEFREDVVNSAHATHKIPSVMMLRKYVNPFAKQSTHKKSAKKRYVFYRDRNQCQYCGIFVNLSALTIDHVTPKSKGGKLEYINLVTSCKKCNSKKGDRSCVDSGMFPITRPRDVTKFDIFRFVLINISKTEPQWIPYFKHIL